MQLTPLNLTSLDRRDLPSVTTQPPIILFDPTQTTTAVQVPVPAAAGNTTPYSDLDTLNDLLVELHNKKTAIIFEMRLNASSILTTKELLKSAQDRLKEFIDNSAHPDIIKSARDLVANHEKAIKGLEDEQVRLNDDLKKVNKMIADVEKIISDLTWGGGDGYGEWGPVNVNPTNP